jgi:hypothetical protein
MPDKWVSAVVVSDTVSAHALCERLIREGVPARVQSDMAVFGAASQCRVVVPQEALHRARWTLSNSEFTESELAWLAMGELGDGKEEERDG